MPALNLSAEQMRHLVLAVLKEHRIEQFAHFKTPVLTAARKSGLAPPAGDHNQGRILGQHDGIEAKDFALVQDVVWDLIIEGVIRPGLTDGINQSLPFIHLTDFGKKVVSESHPTPHDSDGYLARLVRDCPGCDPVILTYITESLHTFRINCLLSSTISLGCASEKAFLLLIDAYAGSLPATRGDQFRKDTEGKPIKRQFDEFNKKLQGDLNARLPGDLKDGLDVELLGLFNFIRTQRNDAGHPTGKTVERESAYANLMVFPVYLRRVYRLIDWVKSNPAP